jgi:hypothetical protein
MSRQEGDVYVECTMTFKGTVRATLYDGLTIAEAVHDIIHAGEYEYEIVRGNMKIDDVETLDD